VPIPKRWQRQYELLQEKEYPVFHNSVDVQVILALIEDLGRAEEELQQAREKLARIGVAL